MRLPDASARNIAIFSLALVFASPGSEARYLDEMGTRIDAERLAAGAEGDHTCLVRPDGNVACWGENTNGQVGDGTSGNFRNQPTAVSGITSAVGVAAGKDHSCALLASGLVQCWGSNATGQLGVGAATAASTVPVTVQNLTSVVAIAAGTGFTCARRADGTVRCWGTNQFGQLGDDTTAGPRFLPVAVSGLTGAIRIAAGATHACALRGGGSMVCWGGNGQGQLGTGDATSRDVPTAVVDIDNVAEIGAGLRFTCASRETSEGSTSRIYCWGDNNLGQLGIDLVSDFVTRPAATRTGGARDIAAGQTHLCMVHSFRGMMHCWGANDAGQLGQGFTSAVETGPLNVDVVAIELAAGRRHTCALGTNDVVRCWGDNARGQLGNLGETASAVPTAVLGPGGSISARRLAAGTNHSCAVRAEGSAACWGRGDGAAIGDGASVDRLVPAAVSQALLPDFRGFVAIAGGGNHNCAVVHHLGSFNFDETVTACWGDNRDGQAFVSPSFVFSPEYAAAFPASGSHVGMSAGSFHTCGVSSGPVACWGLNSSSQLGDGDATVRVKSDVGGLETAVASAAGGAHSCALLVNGRVLCWGGNTFGQLGDGTRTPSASPREASGITNAVSISTIRDHTCALLATGVVTCWGRNDFGQVDGTLGGDRLVPTIVGSVAAGGAVAVTTGFQHTCVLTPGGIVRCWGRNNDGQLGNNTLSDSLAPVTVQRPPLRSSPVTLTGVVGLVSDTAHNCALHTSGRPFCWGRNPEGQLGDGTRTRRLTATGVGSFTANVAREARLLGTDRKLNVVALVNCPVGERFVGEITVTQGATEGRGRIGGECSGGLERLALVVHAHGREGFAAGAATAVAEIVVHERGKVTDEQEWTRAIEILP